MNIKRTILCAFLMICCVIVIKMLDSNKKTVEGLRRGRGKGFYYGYGGAETGDYYDDYSDYPYFYPYLKEYPYSYPNYSYPYYY